MFFVFLKEKDIKMELNYIINHIFNRNELQKFNWINLLQMVKL